MNVAIIPARGGSKGVPRKNIRNLNGRPLIAYTIEAALKSGIFEYVLVSTDSEEIKEIAIQYGADVPFLRPEELSGDEISSDDVVLHALQFLENNGNRIDMVCKLQATSPLRNEHHIADAYRLYQERKADYVVSVCECEHSPLWAGVIGEDLRLDDFMDEGNKRSCRQYLQKYYRLNGAIYIGKAEKYKINKNFLGKNSIAYIMRQEDSIDIDSEVDFKIAEMLKMLGGGK